MLRTERAALAKCRELYKELKYNDDKQYVDPDFGPKDKNDIRGHRFSMYKDGNPP
jgi:hypothetical protein